MAMKCVKDSHGVIRRIRASHAEELVQSGQATYAPKGEWKLQGRLKAGARDEKLSIRI